jgi:hypothetical protein
MRRVVKINIKSSKANKNKPLNLKKTRNSPVLKQCQSVDFSYSPITGFKLGAIYATLALGLVSNPYLAHAETNAVTSYLQEDTKPNIHELGGVISDEHWTRIEFSTIHIDPVVVVEGSAANINNTYVVGIRNVDTMGFEISLKNCNNATDIPVQENVNYSVIEKSRLPSIEGPNTKIRQQFSWGECPATEIITGVVS